MSVIDEYLRNVTPPQREVLEQIRSTIKQVVPEAEETIGYGIPTFRYKGKPLIHFAAFKNHMSVFPTADPDVVAIGEKLAKFRTSKGTLQFTEDNPIPESLIKEIVKVRLKNLS